LAANAAKYGSLGQCGTVRVDWKIEGDELHLNWTERCGPTIAEKPANKGSGTMLAENTLRGRVGGRIDYHWEPDGLRVAMTIPGVHPRFFRSIGGRTCGSCGEKNRRPRGGVLTDHGRPIAHGPLT
jgi:hypothetical protein